MTLRHNTIDPESSSASTAIIMCCNADSGQTPNTNSRIENNLLDGAQAAYTLHCPRQAASNIYVNNNRFRRAVFGYTADCRVPTSVTQLPAT